MLSLSQQRYRTGFISASSWSRIKSGLVALGCPQSKEPSWVHCWAVSWEPPGDRVLWEGPDSQGSFWTLVDAETLLSPALLPTDCRTSVFCREPWGCQHQAGSCLGFLGCSGPPQTCTLPAPRGSEELTEPWASDGPKWEQRSWVLDRQVGAQGETQGKTRSLITHISALYPSRAHTTPSRSWCHSLTTL